MPPTDPNLRSANPKDLLGKQKPPLELVPPSALVECALVMGLGARKYGPYNWRRHSVRHSIYLAAALRHLLQAIDGEKVDAESGRPHEAHAMACMAILLDALHGGNLIEDLPDPGPVSKVIEESTVKMKLEEPPKLFNPILRGPEIVIDEKDRAPLPGRSIPSAVSNINREFDNL